MEWFKRRGTQVSESKTPVFTVSAPSTPELGIDFQTPPTPSRLRSLVGAFRRARRAHLRAQHLPSSHGSIVVATVFGLRRPGARIHLAIQSHPRSPPFAVIELATTTGAFMADIASGPLNFVLRCAAPSGGGTDAPPLWEEARWAQFCNGRVCGSARRRCDADAGAVDLRVIEMLEHVSFGAGILPDYFAGRGTGTVDLVYMRARYERVVRSKDAELLSMLGSDVKGYPEISFNLIRV